MAKSALFFDFDGVVLDSVRVKTHAFAAMFKPFGHDIVEKVVAHHTLHGGVSRYVKLRHYYTEFLGKPVTDADVDELAAEYSRHVFQKVLEVPFIEGFNTFIKAQQENWTCFVVSGTPEAELLKIVDARGIRPHFEQVCGSPATKIEILDRLITEFGFKPSECFFFGDSKTDLDAALHHQIPHICIRSEENSHLWAQSLIVADHFNELAESPYFRTAHV